jgi:dipeptidyl aminopeptidase/acylaminoacyl peptidase
VRCVVARATPTTFLDKPIGAWFLGFEENYALTLGSPEYARAKEASPVTHVTPDDPPFLLLHGDKDETVPFHFSEVLQEALQQVNVPVQLVRVEGAGHGPGFSGAINPPDLDKARVEWFDRYLKAK